MEDDSKFCMTLHHEICLDRRSAFMNVFHAIATNMQKKYLESILYIEFI
jgi:hypothetical protein